MLKMLPALPMLNIDPALPMLRIEPALPIDKIDPALPMLRRLPMLMMLPTLPKLKMLSRLLALAKPARPLLKSPDDVRPLERVALCTAVSSVLARVSLVPLNVGSLAASSGGADPGLEEFGITDHTGAFPTRPRRRVCELRLERRSRRFPSTKISEVGSPNGRLVLLGMPQLSQQPFGIRAPAMLY